MQKIEPLEKEVLIAALADIHCAEDAENLYKPLFQRIDSVADILLMPGDLTRYGRIEEAETLIGELSIMSKPVFAVLGNHDFHQTLHSEMAEILSGQGINVLDGHAAEIQIRDVSVGIAGTKGFGGGFGIRALPEFGEDILKNFYRLTIEEAQKLENGLSALNTDVKIAMLHYAPVAETLLGEPHEIYAFMGSSVFSESVDKYKVDIALHGHAHFGSEEGVTPEGIPVRNVSAPMLGRDFALYGLRPGCKMRSIIV